MKKLIATALVAFAVMGAKAQQLQLHESFQNEPALKAAFLSFDMSSFVEEKTSFVCDTIEKEVNKAELNAMMKQYIKLPKNSQVRKASETNNGYIQTYGIYKGDDAVYYVRFTLNPLSSKLEEVTVEKNN